MQTYEIELQAGSQSRIISMEADSEQHARGVAEAKERKLTDFSLLPPSRDIWEDPHGHSGPDGHVNLNAWDAYHPAFARHAAQLSYQEAHSAAARRLDDFSRRLDIDSSGKVRYANLGPRSTARVLAHNQTEPYAIVDVRKVDRAELDAQALVRQIKAAIENDPRKWKLALAKLREQGIPLNAVTASLAGLPWQKQIDGSSTFVLSSAAIQVSLHTALTFNNDTMDFDDDVTSTEITGTGYTVKGVTLTSKTSTYDTASDQIRLDAADPSWSTSTLSATDAMIWVDTAGGSSTDPLWGNIDFGATVTTTAGTFLITLDATGFVVFDVT